jgi:hypothetical protein
MTMKRLSLAVAALLAATAVNAQIYEWKDENGKTVYSDMPPVGAARSVQKIETGAPATNAPSQKTAADREMDFRKRQKDAQDSAGKTQKEQAAATDKKDNCDKARLYLQSLESGERIALRDEKGERYFMEDGQRQQEIAKAQQAVQSSCK